MKALVEYANKLHPNLVKEIVATVHELMQTKYGKLLAGQDIHWKG